MSPRDRLAKRLFDALVASVGLVVLAPFMGVIAILVRRDSPGPVLFRHRRVGRRGVEFDVLKFRSMRSGSEVGPQFTAADDPRITPVGRSLRRLKLDELPQLWNVLRGEMSLVGPRPDVPGYADHLVGRDLDILTLQPGITGPATLALRDEEHLLLGVEDRAAYYDMVLYPLKVRLDLRYLEQWSMARDLAYLAVTLLPSLDRILRVIPALDGATEDDPTTDPSRDE